MPLSSALLVLLAALCHASWNFAAKRSAAAGTPFLFWSAVLAMVLYAPWAGWVVASGKVEWSAPVLLCIAASGLIHTLYSFALQHGYRVGDLSVVYPVARGTGPLLASLAAFLWLGEVPGALRLAGLAAVIGGIVLLATDGRIEALKGAKGHAGLRWGGITGALIATYTVVDGIGVKRLGVAPVLFDWCANALRVGMLLPAVAHDLPGSLRAMRGHWRNALAVGALSPLGYILVLGALQMGAPLSVVAPMRELSMMLVAVIGMVLLREPVGRARLIGCAAMAAGVVLLGFS